MCFANKGNTIYVLVQLDRALTITPVLKTSSTIDTIITLRVVSTGTTITIAAGIYLSQTDSAEASKVITFARTATNTESITSATTLILKYLNN